MEPKLRPNTRTSVIRSRNSIWRSALFPGIGAYYWATTNEPAPFGKNLIIDEEKGMELCDDLIHL